MNSQSNIAEPVNTGHKTRIIIIAADAYRDEKVEEHQERDSVWILFEQQKTHEMIQLM